MLAVLSALVILGGLKRVAAVTEKVVPFMAVFYVIGALVVVGTHIPMVPAAIASIFKGAFGFKAAGGGVLGYGVNAAITPRPTSRSRFSRGCGAFLRSLQTPSWSAR